MGRVPGCFVSRSARWRTVYWRDGCGPGTLSVSLSLISTHPRAMWNDGAASVWREALGGREVNICREHRVNFPAESQLTLSRCRTLFHLQESALGAIWMQ